MVMPLRHLPSAISKHFHVIPSQENGGGGGLCPVLKKEHLSSMMKY
jgi:hypothetical protein